MVSLTGLSCLDPTSFSSPRLYDSQMGSVYKSFSDFVTWFHVPKLNAWAYTNQSIFPFMYDFTQQKWIYVVNAGSSPVYYKYENDAWSTF